MAIEPTTLLNGTTADANEVMDLFDEIYSNIDETNVTAGNKTGSGKFVLQTTPTFLGDINFDSGTLFVDSTNNMVGIGTITPSSKLEVLESSVGADVTVRIVNSDNTNASSTAKQTISVGGASAGDPLLLLDISGVQDWYMGVDNSDSDKLKLGTGVTVGTTAALTIDTSLNTAIPATKKLYLDGGTGTYLSESSANVLDLVAGSTTVLQGINLSGPTRQGVAIPATLKLFLDSGSNTSIREKSADTIAFEINGSDRIEMNSSGELLLPSIDPPTANYANRNSLIKGRGNSSDTGALSGDYNVASYSKSATGTYDGTWDTDFSSAEFNLIASIRQSTPLSIGNTHASGTGFQIKTFDGPGGAAQDAFHSFVACGVQ